MSSSDVIDISAQPATATWTADNQNCCRLETFKFQIFYKTSTNAAFFKLRAPVTFQATAIKPKRTTAVWLFIAPERIATLALQGDDEIDEATRKQFGTNAVSLCFNLNRPPALVFPPDVDQDCKEQASCEMLVALQSLARATSFTISANLPGRTVSQAHLLSLCTAASRSSGSSCVKSASTSATLVSSKHAADTTSLYGGKGGRVIEGDSPALLALTGNDAMAFEELKSGLRSELKQDLRRELLVELKAELKHELRAELKDELRTELKDELMSEVMQEVETRIFQRVEQSLQAQADDFETQLYDVRHEVGGTIYSEVEDQTYAARQELEDFVKDEMDEAQTRVEDRIIERLQNANMNITFSDL
ncbi:hypothetical protein VP1G_00055 [Cytospora mali]|uniref:Uncharacterized protein n=1 Tax=Cytospora mali TaxID=578113 RepID=A0A194UM47_CYTMA|nr:hypothetical protein VP1G_00055 [Valsa mali var. pyri (nom. inval.)]